VYGCSNESQKDCSISFHTFPKERERKQTWTHFCGRINKGGKIWQPTATSKICSRHFTKSCFEHIGAASLYGIKFKTKLKDSAIPTLHSPRELVSACSHPQVPGRGERAAKRARKKASVFFIN